jgi:hypothetical protein
VLVDERTNWGLGYFSFSYFNLIYEQNLSGNILIGWDNFSKADDIKSIWVTVSKLCYALAEMLIASFNYVKLSA